MQNQKRKKKKKFSLVSRPRGSKATIVPLASCPVGVAGAATAREEGGGGRKTEEGGGGKVVGRGRGRAGLARDVEGGGVTGGWRGVCVRKTVLPPFLR